MLIKTTAEPSLSDQMNLANLVIVPIIHSNDFLISMEAAHVCCTQTMKIDNHNQ